MATCGSRISLALIRATNFAVKPRQPHDNLRSRIFRLTRVTRIFEKSVFTEIAL
jgi:hypothetical protein